MLETPKDIDIFNSLIISKSKIDDINYERIMVSVSGGSDSDILVDIFTKLDKKNKSYYVFFDTGLEYQATKDHLKYLEEKYDIEIQVEKPKKSIPACCKEYGQPFLSKQVSEYIMRLQKHKFEWEDKAYEELITEYPNCQIALKWWCNRRGEKSSFNISYNKYLKEFMLAYPPKFKISNICCIVTKKRVKHAYIKKKKIDLSVVGVRRAEGGARSTSYKNCFTSKEYEADEYRPIFWYKNATKKAYEEFYNITHSRCYTEYGLKRTGCAGCPFGRDFDKELDIIKNFEPKLYKAVASIFKDSYEYTRAYKEFIIQQENRISDEILKTDKGIKRYKQLKLT